MSVVSKLKLTTEKPLVLLYAPKEEQVLFSECDIKTRLPKSGEIDQVVVYAVDQKTLKEAFDNIIPRLTENAMFWLGYPKKSSGLNSDLLKMDSWSFISETDYLITSSAALSDDWSGIRIKKKDPNAKYKRDIPMEERKTAGIDYVNRTVKLPKDAVKAMAEFPELEAFFNSMSFSHKREYVEAIEEAKKPETRQRRIDKMIEMVIDLRDKKERKKK
ncbi:YdeI/OmpD-associated family protein [Polluticoccus soli]|uniref:YdeI/OmpD-associated family protein n=1 Tax=Polluticoccus soli TaxID=3034150 RepID=UPI0023E17A2B|nr:YdeI/OmpD-associated family protein [Flavipsychrobacter sp. JY13-12]